MAARKKGTWLYNPDHNPDLGQKEYTYVPPEGMEIGRQRNLSVEQIRKMWEGVDAQPSDHSPPSHQAELAKSSASAELAKSSASDQTSKQSAAVDTGVLNQSEGTSKKSKGTSAVNKWFTPAMIHDYMQDAEPGALVYEPQNSMQYETIEDFVSTIRAEASQEGSKFKWPERMISFEHAVAISLHHLPPGYMISIRNGRECPAELVNTTEGNLSEYWHGTTCYALAKGIIRDGLKPTLGAGGSQAEEAWGVQCPMVYLSKIQDTAAYYPMHNGLMYNTGRGKETRSGGEIISRDGTPPLRAMVRVQAIDSYQLWHRKVKNNDQRAFRPQDLYISHIMFYALPPIMSAPAQLHYTWHLYAEDGSKIIASQLMEGKDDDWYHRTHKEAYALLTISAEPISLDITKKNLLATRLAHRPTLIVKRYITMWESPKSLPERLRNIHNSIQQEIPVLENTKLNLKDRVEAPTSGASITSVVTDGAHKGGTRTNHARAKARTAKSDNTGYNQSWWEQEAYQGQRWNHPSAGKSAHAGSWGKSSTASGWSSRDNQSQATWDNQSQVSWANQSTWTGEQYAKIGRNGWINLQTKSYTKMYTLAINYMVQPLPFDYYEIDKGNYPPVKPGHKCEITDIYPIPDGQYMSSNSQQEVGNHPTDDSKAATSAVLTPRASVTPKAHLVSNQQTKDFRLRKDDGSWDRYMATQEMKRQAQRRQANWDYRKTPKYYGWTAAWYTDVIEVPKEDPKTEGYVKGIPPPKEFATASLEKSMEKVEAKTHVTKGGFAGATPSQKEITPMPGSNSWPTEMFNSGGQAITCPLESLSVSDMEKKYGPGFKILMGTSKEGDSASTTRTPLHQYLNLSNFGRQIARNSRAYDQHYENGIPTASQAKDSGEASSSTGLGGFNKGETLEMKESDKVTITHKGVAVQPSPSSDPDLGPPEEDERLTPSPEPDSSDDEEQPANPAAAEETATADDAVPEAGYAVDEPSGEFPVPNSFSSALWSTVEGLKKKFPDPDGFLKALLLTAETIHEQSAPSGGNQPSSSSACVEIKDEKPEEAVADAALTVTDPAPDQIMTESQDVADPAMRSDKMSQPAQDDPTDPEQSAQSAPMETEQSAQEDAIMASGQSVPDATMADDSGNPDQLGQSVVEPGDEIEEPDWTAVESADVPVVP